MADQIDKDKPPSFEVKCLKCGSTNCELMIDDDGFGVSWASIRCLDCGNKD